MRFVSKIASRIGAHKKKLALLSGAAVLIPVLLIVGCYCIVQPNEKFVLSEKSSTKADVGIVLGAGVTKDGKPFKELQARLDSAAAALKAGRVHKLILSGDNRFKFYNEPMAMKRYLMERKGVPAAMLQPDYAGRSTYETCERASKIFGVKKAVLFSAGSHLPRAIYLCRHFGVESYGIANHVEANNSTRRELLARVKAVYNAGFVGEHTILGKPISMQ